MTERFRIPWTTGKIEISQSDHPITPPPELVQQWINEENGLTAGHIATRAAQWGADQELEACCEWFVRDWTDVETADKLRAARRPKPPSLKEQALAELAEWENVMDIAPDSPIRRALEQLDD
jgi:hypothetical protein